MTLERMTVTPRLDDYGVAEAQQPLAALATEVRVAVKTVERLKAKVADLEFAQSDAEYIEGWFNDAIKTLNGIASDLDYDAECIAARNEPEQEYYR